MTNFRHVSKVGVGSSPLTCFRISSPSSNNSQLDLRQTIYLFTENLLNVEYNKQLFDHFASKPSYPTVMSHSYWLFRRLWDFVSLVKPRRPLGLLDSRRLGTSPLLFKEIVGCNRVTVYPLVKTYCIMGRIVLSCKTVSIIDNFI